MGLRSGNGLRWEMGISSMQQPCMGDSSKVSLGMPQGAGTILLGFHVQFKRHAGWLNDTLGMRLQKVEDTASGAVACQIMDVLHPGVVPIKKVVSEGCPQLAPPWHGNHFPSLPPPCKITSLHPPAPLTSPTPRTPHPLLSGLQRQERVRHDRQLQDPAGCVQQARRLKGESDAGPSRMRTSRLLPLVSVLWLPFCISLESSGHQPFSPRVWWLPVAASPGRFSLTSSRWLFSAPFAFHVPSVGHLWHQSIHLGLVG